MSPGLPSADVFWLGAILFLVYMLPTFVAERRKHHQLLAIGVLNLLLGWTVIGWVVCLVLACTAVRPRPPLP